MTMDQEICPTPGCGRPLTTRKLCGSCYYRLGRYGDPTAGRARNGEPLAFFLGVVEDPPTECVLWPFTKTKQDYGLMKISGRTELVHRAACRHYYGEPPTPRHWTAHGREKRCVSTLCFNPLHLSWKTPAENQADKERDGTAQRGSRHPRARLTEQQVLEIRSFWSNHGDQPSATYQDLAEIYGVSAVHIGRIVRNESYKIDHEPETDR